MIRGRVENILYTSANGVAYTQLDIYVTEVMRDDGSLVPGDRISVRFLGGYISAREYCDRMGWDTQVPDDSVVYEGSDNYCIPDIGSEYIMFLNDGGYNIPDGGFSFPMSTDQSVLKPDTNGYSTLDNEYYISSYDLENMI